MLMGPFAPGAPEADPRFPSGAWTGFFQQSWKAPGRFRTNLDFHFQDGELWGEGSDLVGRYTVRGTYDPADGRCEWTKQYLGQHTVSYLGYNEGNGIWGVWEIRLLFGLYRDRGVFHLWPAGRSPGAEAEYTYAAAPPGWEARFGSTAPAEGTNAGRAVAFVFLALLLLAAVKVLPLLWDLLSP
jgi:hypothetical protein